MPLQFDGARVVALAGMALAAALAAGAAAQAADMNDVRNLRVGMTVAELPAAGYLEFACAADPAIKLSGWSEYTRCPADAAGRHAIGFRYDEASNPLGRVNESYSGTRISGHPVVIALLIGANARVDAIRIDTDPHALRYMHKKAFLLADQVKERYGQQGWVCTAGSPTPQEQPLGGMFVKEHCEKTTATRHLVLDRELYRNPDADPGKFVNDTRLLIEAAGQSAGR
jgi:hypothetical protein